MEEVKTLSPEERAVITDQEIIKTEIQKYTIQPDEVDKLKVYMDLKITDINDKKLIKSIGEARKIVKQNRLSITKTTKMIDERIKGIKAGVHEHADKLLKELEPIEEHLQLQEAWVEEEKTRIEEEKERQAQIFLQSRIKEMVDAGMTFNGTEYVYGNHKLEAHKIKTFNSVFFDAMIQDVKTDRAADLAKAEEEERIRKEEEERQAELKRKEEEKLAEEKARLQKLADEQAERDRKFREEQEAFEKQKREFEEAKAKTAALEADTKKAKEESAAPVQPAPSVQPTPTSAPSAQKPVISKEDQEYCDMVQSREDEEREIMHSPPQVVKGLTHNIMPSPTEADMQGPLFKGIWEVIKSWDINVPECYSGYTGGNGSHVMLIIQGMRKKFNDLGLMVSIKKKG